MTGPSNRWAIRVSGGLRAEVAEEDAQRVTSGGLHLVDGGEHVLLVFDGGLRLVDVESLRLAGGGDGRTAAFGEGDDEAVAADGDEAQLDNRNILHGNPSFHGHAHTPSGARCFLP